MRRSILLPLAFVVATAAAAVAADGAAVYKQHCASCHGETGKADTPAGKALKAPALAGDATVAGMSDADLQAKIEGNAKHQSFVKKLSADDVSAVATYVKGLAQ
ncbi:MAG: c-type cytochrome [bacterium]|nr:c-type cytochrome [bacterium]